MRKRLGIILILFILLFLLLYFIVPLFVINRYKSSNNFVEQDSIYQEFQSAEYGNIYYKINNTLIQQKHKQYLVSNSEISFEQNPDFKQKLIFEEFWNDKTNEHFVKIVDTNLDIDKSIQINKWYQYKEIKEKIVNLDSYRVNVHKFISSDISLLEFIKSIRVKPGKFQIGKTEISNDSRNGVLSTYSSDNYVTFNLSLDINFLRLNINNVEINISNQLGEEKYETHISSKASATEIILEDIYKDIMI